MSLKEQEKPLALIIGGARGIGLAVGWFLMRLVTIDLLLSTTPTARFSDTQRPGLRAHKTQISAFYA